MSSYSNGIRFRSIVSAWREETDADGHMRDSHRVERVVCVEVDYYPPETQYQRAKAMAQALMQALYPQVNAFDIYNTVDEKEKPSEVLGFVTGWAKGHECYEEHPIVAFRQEHNPAAHREAGALTWAQVFAMDDAAKAVG